MKRLKLFYLLLTALAVTTFTSCSDNDDEQENLVLIDFENITLPNAGYADSLKYEAQGVGFYNKFSDWGNGITSWEGFSYSSLTDKTTIGLVNQYSVFSDGGAGGSKIFAIAYPGFEQPTAFEFREQKMYSLKSIMVNNSTYVALTITNGHQAARKFENGDWYKVIFTGYNATGDKDKSVEYYLADFRNGKSYICSEWTPVNLESLGKVNKIVITMDSSDKGEFINTPTYVCLDNLTYIAE